MIALIPNACALRTRSTRARALSQIQATTLSNFDLNTYLESKKKIVDVALDNSLVSTDKNTDKIIESMRYSLLAGGKRVRPILCLVSLPFKTTCRSSCYLMIA